MRKLTYETVLSLSFYFWNDAVYQFDQLGVAPTRVASTDVLTIFKTATNKRKAKKRCKDWKILLQKKQGSLEKKDIIKAILDSAIVFKNREKFPFEIW